MLIYILHGDKYNTFRLPKKVEGSYVLYDYDNSNTKRSLVNVSAENGKWILKSNSNVYIKTTDANLPSIELQEHNFYSLSAFQSEIILLYVAPSYDNNYICKQIKDNSTVVFGRDAKADIVYAYQGIDNKQLELHYENGKWHMKNLSPSIPIYVNDRRMDNADLLNFDCIFVMGVKIVVCSKLIFISNSLGIIQIMSQNLFDNEDELCVANQNNASKGNKDFYNANEYFSKSPIFLKKYKRLELTITSPEQKYRRNDSSMIMSMVPTILMSLTTVISTYFSISNYKKGQGDKESLITTLVMCAIMLFLALVWPFIERGAESIKVFISERTRVRIYKKYLSQKKKVLEEARDEQKMTLTFNNLSLEECQNTISRRTASLFSRNFDNPSFLTVRLGTGKILLDCTFDYAKPDFVKDKDKLLDKIDDLITEYRYIDNAPYSYSLKNSVAIINSEANYSNYLNAILLQLITFHDYENLKLVVFTSNSSSLNIIKNLNHCWDDEKSMRFFATDVQEADNISSYLIRIFNNRVSDSNNGIYSPYYLVISDDINIYRNVKIIDMILKQKQNIGFSALIFASKLVDIPEGCTNFIDYNNKEASLFKAEMDESSIVKFTPEFINNQVNFDLCVRLAANIPIRTSKDSGKFLPEKFGFLEMYSVGNVKQLNCVNRWKNSAVINTLSAPIGVDSNLNTLNLDLHEKQHGPHGLIAGMTGSGKSEFIVTYILSLAVNYSPDEVQFVLIDYKGGGLAGAFENRKTGIKLPHLVGTITNLDVSSMKRTLVSIKSELQRRQRVFNQAKEQLNIGTIDIYKYQKYVRDDLLTEPMSHLFIICDEFAELKAQQPDFMDELVSAARIGRSLGVHLILATQKPSGVVDDQIWSNSKFKVCCKVQTTEDSKEMIRREDAAYIKESGRFYLQVGYDEIFVKGQSAYTGVPYKPSETVILDNNDEETIEFVDGIGNVIRTVKKQKQTETTDDLGEELSNVLTYLIECAQSIGFQNKQLWLDNIPAELYIDNVRQKYGIKEKKFVINPLIGEYDDPKNQKQGPVSLNLTSNGNLWISGVFGSGKTTLLSTIIYSSIINHITDELNIYIADLLAGSLKSFLAAPQVGDFISPSDGDKLNKLFYYLNTEIAKRRNYFSNHSGSFSSNAEKGYTPFPNILVIINGIDVLVDSYGELYQDVFLPLIRDCNRFGIIFIITSTGSISYSITNNFAQKIALKYLDVSEYKLIFNDTGDIIPGSNPGRGLVELDTVYEFQSAMIFNENDYEKNMTYVFNKLATILDKAPPIPSMPRVVTFENVKDNILSLDMVPIGIDMLSNCIYSYDFTRLINLIVYSNEKTVVAFEMALLKILTKLNNVKVFALDTMMKLDQMENVQLYTSNFKTLCMALHQNIIKKKTKDPTAEKIIFVISNYSKIENHLEKLKTEDETVKTVDDLIDASKDAENYKFILLNDSETENFDDKAWSDYVDAGNGIIIGMEASDQNLIEVDGSYDETKVTKDVGIVINEYKKSFIKYVRERR